MWRLASVLPASLILNDAWRCRFVPVCGLMLIVVLALDPDARASTRVPADSAHTTIPAAGATSGIRPLDRTDVVVRSAPDDRLRDYRTDDAYDYREEDPPARDATNPLMEAIGELFSNLFQSRTGRVVFKWGFYVVAAGLVGYGLLVLIRMEPSASRRRRGRPSYTDEGLDQRVPETDFHELIERARDAGDHRSVLRLHYLLGLQVLNDNDWIRWRPERTNHHYEQTLRDTPLDDSFREATRTFDIVWYGDVQIGESDLVHLLPPFKTVIDRAQTVSPGQEADPANGAFTRNDATAHSGAPRGGTDASTLPRATTPESSKQAGAADGPNETTDSSPAEDAAGGGHA